MMRSDARPNNFEWQIRKRNPDEKFRDSDTTRTFSHDSVIASAHNHAASGNCMTIDGRDDWARKLQQLTQTDLEGGKKPA